MTAMWDGSTTTAPRTKRGQKTTKQKAHEAVVYGEFVTPKPTDSFDEWERRVAADHFNADGAG
jgi:hypothetical protein